MVEVIYTTRAQAKRVVVTTISVHLSRVCLCVMVAVVFWACGKIKILLGRTHEKSPETFSAADFFRLHIGANSIKASLTGPGKTWPTAPFELFQIKQTYEVLYF